MPLKRQLKGHVVPLKRQLFCPVSSTQSINSFIIPAFLRPALSLSITEGLLRHGQPHSDRCVIPWNVASVT